MGAPERNGDLRSLGSGDFWSSEDRERASARSRGRAGLALRLLERASIRGGRLLDLGCGPGWVLEAFRSAGFEVLGVDSSREAVRLAREKGLPAEVLDVERDELPSGYSLISAFEVLEHLRDPLEVLGRMVRALEPGGALLVSLPNEFHLPRRLSILFGKPAAAGHREFGGHRDPHLRLFTPKAAESLFLEAGLEVLDRAFSGLLPPRWIFQGISGGLAALRPSLFSISGVYLLGPRGAASSRKGGKP